VADKPQISDRRAGCRCTCSLTAACEPIPAAEHFHGTVHNISEDGLGLVLEQQLMTGLSLWVVMRGADDVLLGKMMVRIVHATPQQDGHWLHGCLFAKEPIEDDARQSRTMSDSGIAW
jgi:hypothetical protein